MTNPLARAVMENIGNKSKKHNPCPEEKKLTNMTSKDVELVRNIISRDMELRNSSRKGEKITLDEAVERIKNGSR